MRPFQGDNSVRNHLPQSLITIILKNRYFYLQNTLGIFLGLKITIPHFFLTNKEKINSFLFKFEKEYLYNSFIFKVTGNRKMVWSVFGIFVEHILYLITNGYENRIDIHKQF